MKGKHSAVCNKYNPGCLCYTCGRDNYREKTFKRCCYVHERKCGSKQRCKDYIAEGTPEPEEDKQIAIGEVRDD